jgi:death-on-curing protein
VTVYYLDLADLLVIAEWVLGESAESIERSARLELAESALHAPAAAFGGVEFHPDLPTKAAVLCVRLVKNHPLVDGNKRLGFVCMIEFLRRNGRTWTPPEGDEDGEASTEVIMSVASGPGDDPAIRDLAVWIEERISAP